MRTALSQWIAQEVRNTNTKLFSVMIKTWACFKVSFIYSLRDIRANPPIQKKRLRTKMKQLFYPIHFPIENTQRYVLTEPPSRIVTNKVIKVGQDLSA